MNEDNQKFDSTDDNFEVYQKKTLVKARHYVQGEDLSNVSCHDLEYVTPTQGDFIAKNEGDEINLRLISKEYFEKHYEKLDVTDVTNEEPEQQKDNASE